MWGIIGRLIKEDVDPDVNWEKGDDGWGGASRFDGDGEGIAGEFEAIIADGGGFKVKYEVDDEEFTEDGEVGVFK